MSRIPCCPPQDLTALGEVVGAVSKGMTQEAIDAIPVASFGQLPKEKQDALDK